MPEKFNFTKSTLTQLPAPPTGKRALYYDSKCTGLCLRITSSGAKAFYFYRKVKGRPVMRCLGPFSDLTIEQARGMVFGMNGSVASGDGIDPKAKDPTFGDLFTWYLENHAKARKVTWKEDLDKYNRHIKKAFGTRRVSDIGIEYITAFHSRLKAESGTYAANRNLALIRTVFNKARKNRLISIDNPAQAIELFPEQQRDRRIMDSEMQAFIQALQDEPNQDIRDFVWLCLLSGARRSNVLTMQWQDISIKDRHWRIPKTKTGDAQVVPLTKEEIAILESRKTNASSEWVFPSPRSKSGHMVEPQIGWRRILERAGLKDLRIHDLRRTHASLLADTGASWTLISKALNHKSAQTTRVYARMDQAPLREAKERALESVLKSSRSETPTDNASRILKVHRFQNARRRSANNHNT